MSNFFKVVSTEPDNYASNVSISGVIRIAFSKDVDEDTLNEFTVYLRKDREYTRIPINIYYDLHYFIFSRRKAN